MSIPTDGRLLVIVPSRGRPERLAALLAVVEASKRGDTRVAVGLDGDDPRLGDYLSPFPAPGGLRYIGDRRSLTGWTNEIAMDNLGGGYTHFASFGDDHLPRTVGWDVELMRAAGRGISYGDDMAHGEKLATAPVMSVGIVRALGWMCHPKMGHYCIDNVWTDIGRAVGCLTYCPEVIVEHLHPAFGKGVMDATYADAGGFHTGHPDYQAYLEWQKNDAATDAEKVLGALNA